MLNLATLSGKRAERLKCDEVTCEPREVRDSEWCDVAIRVRSGDLKGVKLKDCRLNDCYLGNAGLRLDGASFERCDIRDTTFMHAKLSGSTFTDCFIARCALRRADLRTVSFVACTLASIDLEGAELHGAQFVETELLHMEDWGWHGYAGAQIPDEQKFKYFHADEVAARLRAAIQQGHFESASIEPFVIALEEEGFGSGDVCLIHEEWKEQLSLSEFIEIGKFLTEGRA